MIDAPEVEEVENEDENSLRSQDEREGD